MTATEQRNPLRGAQPEWTDNEYLIAALEDDHPEADGDTRAELAWRRARGATDAGMVAAREFRSRLRGESA